MGVALLLKERKVNACKFINQSGKIHNHYNTAILYILKRDGGGIGDQQEDNLHLVVYY